MQAQQWSDILKLSAMMIIGNKLSERDERRLFEKTALSLKADLYPDLTLTQQMAADWLALHRDEIVRSLTSVHFDESLNTLLKNLQSLPNKKFVIIALIKMTLTEDRTKNQNRVINGMNDHWGNPSMTARAV